MPSNSPAVLPPLVSQPVMAEDLGIEVVCFKRRMMNVPFWSLKEEETMVIYQLFTSIKTTKSVESLARARFMDELAGKEVEMRGVEIKRLLKIRDTNSNMT